MFMFSYDLLRYLHIGAASIGLLTMLVPLIAKKGGTLHVKVGWVFTSGMAVAALTGMAIAVLWVVAPRELKPNNPNPERLRAFAVFLAFLGILTLNSLHTALRAISRKNVSSGTASAGVLVMPSVLFASGVLLLGLGLYYVNGLFLAFAALGLFAGRTDYLFFRRPLKTRMSWWYEHMAGMNTACIAAVTAFLVFNSERIVGGPLPPSIRFLPWILPTILGVPAALYWVRYYRKRWGEVT